MAALGWLLNLGFGGSADAAAAQVIIPQLTKLLGNGMAIRAESLTVNFLAWDTTNNVGKTGDSGNFTMRLIKDGGSPTVPDNALSEPDATNLKGIYEVVLTSTEMTANFLTLGGESSTANIVIFPLLITTERGSIAVIDTVVDAGATAAALSTAQTDLDTLTGSDGVTLATTQGNYAPSTVAALSTAQTDLDTLTGSDGATLATTQGNYAPSTVAALATAQTDLDTITGSDGVTLATAQGLYAPNKVVPDAAGTAPTLAELQTTALTESYASNGSAPTQNQMLYAIHQMLMEFAISGTSYTVKKLDSSTTAFVVTLDDATNPTSNTR